MSMRGRNIYFLLCLRGSEIISLAIYSDQNVITTLIIIIGHKSHWGQMDIQVHREFDDPPRNLSCLFNIHNLLRLNSTSDSIIFF